MALHSLSLAQSLSTLLRSCCGWYGSNQDGRQADRNVWRAGMAGLAPHVPDGLEEDVAGVSARSATIPFGRGGKAFEARLSMGQLMGLALIEAEGERPAASAITHALVPYPPRERPSASRWSRSSPEPPFARPRRLGLSTDVGPIQIGHAQLNALPLLSQSRKPLPAPKARPADEVWAIH